MPLDPGKDNTYVTSHYNDIQSVRRYTLSCHNNNAIQHSPAEPLAKLQTHSL